MSTSERFEIRGDRDDNMVAFYLVDTMADTSKYRWAQEQAVTRSTRSVRVAERWADRFNRAHRIYEVLLTMDISADVIVACAWRMARIGMDAPSSDRLTGW